MSAKFIVLISKDATPKHFLPTYGNKYWKTPNIDKVAKNGIVFNNYYACAGSTSMSFYSMITGQLSYQTERKNYDDEIPFDGINIFEKFKNLPESYDSYLIWDKSYTKFSNSHLDIFKNAATVIPLDIKPTDSWSKRCEEYNKIGTPEETQEVVDRIEKTFLEIKNKNKNSFIWIHLPHVMKTRYCLGSDIDIFDKVVGVGIDCFGIDSIFISADHGMMDGKRGIFGYGFDLDQPVINIPLICPNVGNISEHKDDFISNNQLFNILNGKIEKQDFVISDSAYYEQKLRTLVIIHNGYKLEFVKEKRKFYLFDVLYDPDEKYDLLSEFYYDSQRRNWFFTKVRYFYPKWDNFELEKKILFAKFNEIYREGSKKTEFLNRLALKRLSYISRKKAKQKPKTIHSLYK